MVAKYKADSFAKGAGILALAGLLARTMGAVYRIPLARILGSEGIGLFQLAFPLYSMMLAAATAGFPVAISKMVAEREAVGDRVSSFRILKVSLGALGVTGGLSFAALATFSGYIALNLYHEPRAASSLVAMSPAILLLSLAAGFRGFFQGIRVMAPSGSSQVTEQVVRVSFMIAAALTLSNCSLGTVVAGVSGGAAAGALVGLAMLTFSFLRFRHLEGGSDTSRVRTSHRSSVSILKELATLGLPIAAGAVVVPLSGMLDSIVVPARLLASGFGQKEAVSLYGQLTGMALVLAYFPTVITTALAANLVPTISAARIRRDRMTLTKRVDYALRLALVFALPASIGLYILAPEITSVLFDCQQAGSLLQILSIGTFFLCIQQTCSGILQGMGMVVAPVKNLLVGLLLKFVLCLVLTNSSLGVHGAAWATVAGFALSAILTLRDVVRATSLGLSAIQTLLRPTFSVTVMVPAVTITKAWVFSCTGSSTVGLICAVVVGSLAYFALLILIGGVAAEDLEMIPKVGPSLSRCLLKVGLIRM